MKTYLAVAICLLCCLGGCADALNAPYVTPETMDRGMIYILPGIQGLDYHYVDIRKGLEHAGVDCAIMIHSWGNPMPGVGALINETDVAANRAWGTTMADEITAYHRQYPNRPVYTIGHSGGGAISVFTAEALSRADRSRLGDWEGDTVVGKGRSGYVATCVERASRYLVARKQLGCSAKETAASLYGSMRRLPPERRRTLTVDNGREFAGHEGIGRLLRIAVYFAHPYSSWERGTNENTNGLLRQYLPKTESFAQLTGWQLEGYVLELNNRPRKCLNYRTPAEVFWRRNVALEM